jgi:hypothetical protein
VREKDRSTMQLPAKKELSKIFAAKKEEVSEQFYELSDIARIVKLMKITLGHRFTSNR